jgi:hypothetical protein
MDLILSIGWWPVPAAAIVGFVTVYILRRSIWVLYTWPWDILSTAKWSGTGAGILAGLLDVQLRRAPLALGFDRFLGFAILLLIVSCSAATVSAIVALTKTDKNLMRSNDRSFSKVDFASIHGYSFKRMDEAERKNYKPSSQDAFIYKIPRSGDVLIYEPALGMLSEHSSLRVTKWLQVK